MNTLQAALAGIRILDFSHVFQGPVATQLLADFGADVIKVERPGAGDWSRSWGPFLAGVSMPFANLNRNKRSIALNMKHPEGREIAHRLVQSADVLVHNFRAGVMEKLGLGYEELRRSNPRLIYASSSGWGDTGPYVERGRGGHDLMARAEAGWFHQDDPDDTPIATGISADYPAGLMLAQGILIALLARERTGQGQLVTTDLLSVAFHAHAWDGSTGLNRERLHDDGGVGATEAAIDKAFRTRDGWIELSPVFSENALRDIAVGLGLGDLSADPRFATPQAQLRNRAAMNAILAQRFLEKDTGDWIAALEPQGVLCGKIRSFEAAAEDPQIAANHMVLDVEHPDAGTLRLLGTPLRLHGTPANHRLAPPDLGQHTREILTELGYSQDQQTALAQAGVIGVE